MLRRQEHGTTGKSPAATINHNGIGETVRSAPGRNFANGAFIRILNQLARGTPLTEALKTRFLSDEHKFQAADSGLFPEDARM